MTINALLAQCASVHIFPDGKAIFKFPLGADSNKVVNLDSVQLAEVKDAIKGWRLVTAGDVLHAVKNPEKGINTVIPEGLSFDGKSIVFGEVGAGKSTLLSTIGRAKVENGLNIFTVESPMALSLEGASRLENTEEAVSTVLLCRPDFVLFDEIRERKHYRQLKDLSLACSNIVGSLHATNIFEALARFASLNGERTYGELATLISQFVHIENGQIVNWYSLKTTLSSQCTGEFYADGERPVTTVYDKDNCEVGWIFYFANDINIVKNGGQRYWCPKRGAEISKAEYQSCHNCNGCEAEIQ